ncbi:MAG: 4-hydroxy-2-oxovalerate aldolase, partial [Sedimentisphaerales bacterium]|nr:4-hydroxy-2-oxovalerate aldolase [Sedimentisphaerales bacterium]
MTTNSPADKSVKILDCTIRDGSYLIDYQFTVEDAYLIASALCQAGIKYIEVGHGLGLDAQWRGKGLAAESDHAYIEASVAATEKRSKIGVFFIPGIGDIESIRQAADVGLDFVRVGTNVNEYMQAREAVEVAKQLGLKVWSNLMKSYIVPPDEFARICREVEKYGVDVITVVDSAGGMTPGSVRQYVSAAKSVVNCALGFHGHNNLQLVMGNSLAAVESGCVFIDASLRGMGRSAGNAATEILCALLIREGVDIGEVNYKKLIRIADELVVPMMPHDRGLLPIEIACGLSHFHSSFLPIVEKSGAEHGVAAFEVILEMNAKTKAFIDKGLADKAAKKAAKSLSGTKHGTRPAQVRPWISAQPATVAELWKALKELSAKTGYKLVLTIARSRNENQKSLRITPVRVGYGYCVGHIESPSAEHDIRIFEQLETI